MAARAASRVALLVASASRGGAAGRIAARAPSARQLRPRPATISPPASKPRPDFGFAKHDCPGLAGTICFQLRLTVVEDGTRTGFNEGISRARSRLAGIAR